jgi:ApeA N-terminal domain 1/Apea-like HEPN
MREREETGADLHEYWGRWWLPDRPENKVGGVLRAGHREGFELTLGGMLQSDESRSVESVPVIFGEVASFERTTTDLANPVVTLHKCHLMRTARRTVSSYYCSLLVLGEHLSCIEEPALESVSVSIDALDVWNPDRTWNQDLDSSGRIAVSFKETPRYELDLGDSLRLVLWSAVKLPGWSAADRRITVWDSLAAQFTPDLPVDLRGAYRLIQPLLDLLTFLGQQPARVTSFYVTPSNSVGDTHRWPVRVIDNQREDRTQSRKYMHPHDFLISFPKDREDLEVILGRWFGLHLGAEHQALVQFFATEYSESLFLESTFQLLVQAIEGWHRARYPEDGKLPKAAHRERVEAILASTPEEHREWAGGLLRSFNSASLLQRIGTMLEKHDDLVGPVLTEMDPPFAGQIRDMRNALAHSSTPGADGYDYARIHYLNRCMRHLIQAALLRAVICDPEKELSAMGRLKWPPTEE